MEHKTRSRLGTSWHLAAADVATRLPCTPPFSRLLRHAGGYSKTILTPNLQGITSNLPLTFCAKTTSDPTSNLPLTFCAKTTSDTTSNLPLTFCAKTTSDPTSNLPLTSCAASKLHFTY